MPACARLRSAVEPRLDPHTVGVAQQQRLPAQKPLQVDWLKTTQAAPPGLSGGCRGLACALEAAVDALFQRNDREFAHQRGAVYLVADDSQVAGRELDRHAADFYGVLARLRRRIETPAGGREQRAGGDVAVEGQLRGQPAVVLCTDDINARGRA